MRIFAISDLHGDATLARNAAEHAREHDADVVMIAGDISNFGRAFTGVIAPFRDLNVPLLIVSGNHDDPERIARLAAEYDAVHLDGYGVVISGIGFIGTRGLNLGASRQDHEQIHEYLTRAKHYTNTERIVSMTHGHPSGTLMEHLSAHVSGSESIEALIKDLAPAVHICGHVHEAAGLVEEIGTTKLVNVARNPTIIDLE